MIILTSQRLKHSRSVFLAHAAGPVGVWVGTCQMQRLRVPGCWRMKLLHMRL